MSPSSMFRSCSTTSATRRSRRDLRAVFTAVTAASSQDWVLVPMTSMTRYTLTEASSVGSCRSLVPPGSGRYARGRQKPSEAIIENWWRQGMMGGAKAHYDGIVAFSQTDFTEDLKKITVPVLVMHGDDDQIVPYAGSGPLSARLLQNGTLKTYQGFPHGMPTTQAETINADLLAFIQS